MIKLIRISEASKLLGLVDPITNKPLNHILRYWEKEFKKIKPKKINKIRYYNYNQIEILKMIYFLLKIEKMTISGAKKVLNSNINKLDDNHTHSLKTYYHKKQLKIKSKKILNKIRLIKSYGKKNTHQS